MIAKLRNMLEINENNRISISWGLAASVLAAMVGGAIVLGGYMARVDDTMKSNRDLQEKVDKIDRNVDRMCYALNEALENKKKQGLPCDRMQNPKTYSSLTSIYDLQISD